MVGVGIATLSEMMMMVEDKNVNFAQTRVDICLSWSFSTTTTYARDFHYRRAASTRRVRKVTKYVSIPLL